MAEMIKMTVCFYLDALCRVQGVMLENVLIFGRRDYYAFEVQEIIEPDSHESLPEFAQRVIRDIVVRLKEQRCVAQDIIAQLELFI